MSFLLFGRLVLTSLACRGRVNGASNACSTLAPSLPSLVSPLFLFPRRTFALLATRRQTHCDVSSELEALKAAHDEVVVIKDELDGAHRALAVAHATLSADKAQLTKDLAKLTAVRLLIHQQHATSSKLARFETA